MTVFSTSYPTYLSRQLEIGKTNLKPVETDRFYTNGPVMGQAKTCAIAKLIFTTLGNVVEY
jgi:hypothetical protein